LPRKPVPQREPLHRNGDQSMRINVLCFLVPVIAIMSAPVKAASFDCTKASQAIENIICDNGELSSLDEQMAAIYKQALEGSGDLRSSLVAVQQRWLRDRIRACRLAQGLPQGLELEAATECIRAGYKSRVAELSAWPSRESETSVGACRAIQEQVRALDGSDSTRAWSTPALVGLDSVPNSSVKIAQKELMSGSLAEVDAALKSNFNASPQLIDAIKRLSGGGNVTIRVYEAGPSNLHMAEVIRGTAGCQHFAFFGTSRDIVMSGPVDAPLVVKHGDEASFCRGEQGWIGIAQSSPAFFVERGLGNTVDISVTLWNAGHWQPECHASIKFRSEFKVADRFCNGVDCTAFSAQAKSLAAKCDADPKAYDAAASEIGSRSAEFNRMKQHIGEWNDQMPTFGNTASSSYTGFGAGCALMPVKVGGETYIARLSNSSLGWRESPDYVFAAYRMAGDKLEPVAGIYIAKLRGNPTEVTIK
jgi:uncharacterized protein